MIYTIDDFLDKDDLMFYKKYVIDSNLSQNIRKDASITTRFWEKYGEKINKHLEKELQFSGLYDNVTLTNAKNPVIRHRDSKIHDEKYKILLYLNDVPNGGTVFFIEKSKKQLVINKENRLVIFDITLDHESQKFTGCSKIAIGFRPII